MKTGNRDDDHQQKTFSAVINQRNLLLFNLNSPQNPYQLIFEQKYGKIVNYEMFGDGYTVIGFSNGFITHVSAYVQEMGKK